MSLMARPAKAEAASKFSRSNTLSRSEARAAREKVGSGSASNTSTSTICLECRNELASVIWGKKSPRTPSKRTPSKSIYDLKSMTITKRRLSRQF